MKHSDKRRCRECLQDLDVSNFGINVTTPNKKHYKTFCKACAKKIKNGVGLLKKRVKSCKIHCELCGSKEKLYFDHCHASGVFRGWLCINCNHALGKFKDSEELLLKAIKYVSERSREDYCHDDLEEVE